MRKYALKRYSLMSVVLLLFLVSEAQQIARRDVLSDLLYLEEAVRNGHPVNYQSPGKLAPHQTRRQVENMPDDSLSVFDYRFILGAALQEIGCVHTAVIRNPLMERINGLAFFPFPVYIVSGKLYFARSTASAWQHLAGQEIQTINGRAATQIVERLLQYSASDGGGDAFVAQQINKRGQSLLALCLGFPQRYEVQLDTQTIVMDALSRLNAPNTPTDTLSSSVLLAHGPNELKQQEGLTVLKIRTFTKSDRRFIRQAFALIRTMNCPQLVLDLRGNPGGSRKTSAALTRQLIEQPFDYEILQPKLDTWRYLNPKGKLFWALSRWKYNVVDAYRGRRTDLGRSFVYRFRPARQPYTGPLYVLTDGITASASTMVTSWLKQHRQVVLVGRQAGGGYNGNNGGAFPRLTLPQSGIELVFPAYRLILDRTSPQNAGLMPDFEVGYTIDDLISGKDKDLHEIKRLIQATTARQ